MQHKQVTKSFVQQKTHGQDLISSSTIVMLLDTSCLFVSRLLSELVFTFCSAFLKR